MAAQNKKCAHPPCSCTAAEGSRYCSVECEAMEKTPDLDCLCPHAGRITPRSPRRTLALSSAMRIRFMTWTWEQCVTFDA